MTEINEVPQENGSGTQTWTVSKKTYLTTIIIALILLSAVWIWKSVEISNLKKTTENEKLVLQQNASKQLVETHEQHLKLLAKPFVWAVRSEMMQGNTSQVNLYMNDMVKEKNFQKIAVVNEKGVIVSSTNKKDEGKPFSTLGNNVDLNVNSTNIQNVKDSVLIMVSPVMGFNNRLGTLYIQYSISESSLRQ